jgi:hypothetical protein
MSGVRLSWLVGLFLLPTLGQASAPPPPPSPAELTQLAQRVSGLEGKLNLVLRELASLRDQQKGCTVAVEAETPEGPPGPPPMLYQAGGEEGEVVYVNQKGFTIPISVKPERRADVRELVLYVSRDQGRTWEIHGRTAPDRKGFDYFANSDGLVWFSVAVIDKQGKQDPPDPYRTQVGQKICVDTVKPVVNITTAERHDRKVLVQWGVCEEHPDWTSYKLEYRSGSSESPWKPLPTAASQPEPQRGVYYDLGDDATVTLRVRFRDLAGNEGSDECVVSAPGPSQDRAVPSAPTIKPVTTPIPTRMVRLRLGDRAGNEGSDELVVSAPGPSQDRAVPSAPTIKPVTTPILTRAALPLLQIVNKKQAKIEFEVPNTGRTGLGTVDVYVTTDEGATWEKAPADSSPTLPVTGEARGVGPVQGSVTVSLPRDGVIYGFYLVVKSKSGLGKPPPRPGDPPQVRIEADTTPPLAKLYAPVPHPSCSDRLVLSWEAEDRNLAPNPVSLEWAAWPNGPWSFIGDPQLPNTGRYSWQVPDNAPAKVYLRLSVRDLAGNVAVAQTDQSVIIETAPPEVPHIKLVTGVP